MSEENEKEKFTIDGVGEDDMDLSDKIEHVFKTELFEEDLGDFSSEIKNLEDRVNNRERKVENIGDRLEELESRHESDIEDIRERVVQIARMVNNSGKQQQEEILDQLDDVESELSDVQDSISQNDDMIDDLGYRLDRMRNKNEEFERKLDRLAESHLELKDEVEEKLSDISKTERRMERLTKMAQRKKIMKARCESCSGTVLIPYLNECKCSNCGRDISEIRNRFLRPPLILTEDK